MAFEKNLKTRIVLTHDEYADLKGKKLKEGEVVLAKVGTTEANGKVSEPIWMMKVGKGNDTTVENCPWLVAPAADVYEWAKKSSLNVNDVPVLPPEKLPELGITLKQEGEGNAVTAVTYDDTTKTFTITKGKTFATKKEFDDHSHQITATDDDVIIATGGDLSVDVKHKKELGEGKSYTTEESTGVSAFGGTATLNIPSLTVNEYGHITAIEDKEVTISIPTPEEVSLPTVEDNEVEGQFVTEVDQTAGAIAVTRKAVDVVYGDDGFIKLTIDGTPIGTGFDAAEFVKDGFLSKVDKDTKTNELIFTWNTDAGVTETRIDIDELVEVYTSGEGVTIENFVVSHAIPTTVATNVTKTARTYVSGIEFDKFGHVTKIETGVEEDQDLTHNHDDQYKKLQTVVEKDGAAGKTITKVTQNENGEVDVTYEDIAITSSQVIDLDVGVTKVSTTANNGLKVTPEAGTGDVVIDIDDTIVFILDGGDASDLD